MTRPAALAAGLLIGLLAAADPAAGQTRMRLTGTAESNVAMDTVRVGDKKQETLAFGSRYSPVIDGQIWNSRFITFSLGANFSDQTTQAPNGNAMFTQFDPYRLQLSLFPSAPHSFALRAGRTITESTLGQGRDEILATTTSTNESLSWLFRGTPRLPELTVDLSRQSTESEAETGSFEETRTTLTLRTRKSLGWAEPTLTYAIERTESETSPTLAGIVPKLEREGIGHQIQYDDRIRLAEKVVLSPVLSYRTSETGQAANAGMTLSGPLSATLDATGGLRYSFIETEGIAQQSVSADAVFTKRFAPGLTGTAGANAVMSVDEAVSWGAGTFAGMSYMPLPHLTTTADYGLQLTFGETATVSHRGHAGVISTYIPRHTLAADYFISLFDKGGEDPLFSSHGLPLLVTSLVVPRTTLTGSYDIGVETGAGEQHSQSVRAAASVRVRPALTTNVGGQVSTRTSSGGARPPMEERSVVGDVGIDGAPFSWLTLSVTGAIGVRDVVQEDKVGKFVTERASASATFTRGRLGVRVEGFVEQEPLADYMRQGVRTDVAWQFRIWTIAVSYERSSIVTARTDSERDRFAVRITRPLSYQWP